MTEEDIKLGQSKCEAKTAKGNCYLNYSDAVADAIRMTARYEVTVVAFRCKFGAHWHIGRSHFQSAKEGV